MAKRGLTLVTAKGVLASRQSGWALCVGAGTSYGIFPSWEELARGLIGTGPGPANRDAVADELLRRSSLESVIQAAKDHLKLDDVQFQDTLANALYQNLRNAVTDWPAFSGALDAKSPGEIPAPDWTNFLNTIRTAFPQSSALQIASTIVEAHGQGRSPEAILTFNAEPLLGSLVNALSASHGDMRQLLDRQVGALSLRQPGRIPYYFCHGLLPVPGVRARRGRSSVDKLVFSESQYLQLGNAAYSWQSAAFYNVCAKASTVFVGLSLADPNIRRWLSWMHTGRLAELSTPTSGGASTEDSATHYWLKCKTSDPFVDRWIESSVAHLGVRLVWLNDWSQVGSALASMLELR